MSPLILSLTGIPVQRLMCLVGTDNGMMVQVCRCGLPEFEDSLDSLQKVFEDVPHLLEKRFCRNIAPAFLDSKVYDAYNFQRRGV